jgi:hypothetical protein
MVISNLIEFFLMKDYGLRARLLAVLFVDHIYVIIAWALNINYTLFYIYFARIDRLLDVSADLVLNFLFISTEAGFVLIPYLFPELSNLEQGIFQRNVKRNGSQGES